MTDRKILARLDASSLLVDVPTTVEVGGEQVIVVRHRGRVCALAGTCTHLGAPLADGLVVDGEIRCPWHHARFSLDTGEAVGAPAFQPLTTYEAVERDGQIEITAVATPEPAAQPSRGDGGRIVIVGGGGAGHACAEMLARLGAGSRVTLFSGEGDAPYDRTFCSKQYLSGDKGRAEAALPGLADVDVRLGVSVVAIDADASTVTTDAGDRIDFATLILATGAAPVVPDFDGDDRDDVFVLRSLQDADRLIEAAQGANAAVVMGSSYVALEAAASLTKRGLTVTVVSDGDVPLAKTAGPEIGAMVRRLHEDHGVTFRMGREVTCWTGTFATLDDGSTAAGTLLVAGTGVEPRLDLARDAGLTIADKDAGGGVLTDATLRTSRPNIYAIGDIASVHDPRLGHPIRVEHWVVAQRMGQWLARHLVRDGTGEYGEVPFFWSGHYDSNLRYVGHVAAPDDRRIDGDVADQDVAVTFREDGRDQAVLTCGRDHAALEVEAAWTR